MINELHAQAFCKDDISKIENYDKAVADSENVWDCHHRLELTLDGEFAHSRDELKRFDMYYHRPYFELIFLTKYEHTRLHMKGNNHFYGKNHSDDTKQKISESMKGIRRSDETRKKMSEAKKRSWIERKARKKS